MSVKLILEDVLKKYPQTKHEIQQNGDKSYLVLECKINGIIKTLSVEIYPNDYFALTGLTIEDAPKSNYEHAVGWIIDYFEFITPKHSFLIEHQSNELTEVKIIKALESAKGEILDNSIAADGFQLIIVEFTIASYKAGRELIKRILCDEFPNHSIINTKEENDNEI